MMNVYPVFTGATKNGKFDHHQSYAAISNHNLRLRHEHLVLFVSTQSFVLLLAFDPLRVNSSLVVDCRNLDPDPNYFLVKPGHFVDCMFLDYYRCVNLGVGSY